MSKILIIDDDVLSSRIYATKLQAANYEVELCGESEKALEIINSPFDLIILDIMMPKIDGTQILDAIRKSLNENSILLVFTNLFSEKTKSECLEKGAKEYLIKADFTPGQLLEKIKTYLAAN